MIYLQLSLCQQFKMCLDIEQYARVHKHYEAKQDHYSRYMCYCNISLSVSVEIPPVQSGDSCIQIPHSWNVQ